MMITIQVNEQSLEINDGFNILQVLTQINLPVDGIAVAVNNTVIIKNLWACKILSENDTVLIIQATQGG